MPEADMAFAVANLASLRLDQYRTATMAAELVTTAVPWMCGVARGEARRARKCRGDGEGKRGRGRRGARRAGAEEEAAMHRRGNIAAQEGDAAMMERALQPTTARGW